MSKTIPLSEQFDYKNRDLFTPCERGSGEDASVPEPGKLVVYGNMGKRVLYDFLNNIRYLCENEDFNGGRG